MRSIVYNNIDDSAFFIDVGKCRIYFSSEFNKSRFLKNYKNYIDEENAKLENKYHVKIVANYYLLFAFYKKIEKRGFRVVEKETNRKLGKDYIIESNIFDYSYIK